MTQEELKFIEENIHNFKTVEVGYVKNIELAVLEEYERIYKKYVTAEFVLTAWCSSCVFDMLNRLKTYYDKHIADKFYVEENLAVIDDLPFVGEIELQTEPKKRGRKPKQ